jgi:hypothetical protein
MTPFFKALALFSLLLLCCCQKDKPAAPIVQKPAAVKPLSAETAAIYLGNTLVNIEKIKKADFDALPGVAIDTVEANYLRHDSLMVHRAGTALFFKTKAKQVTIANNDKEDDETAVAHYTYRGFIKSIGQFLVYGTYYEEYNYLLIDAETGDITHLWGMPVVSPDGKFFIAGNCDLVATFTPNGLQLFKSTHKPGLVGEKELVDWGPEELKWLDDKTLLTKVKVSDTKSPDLQRTEYFKLTLK